MTGRGRPPVGDRVEVRLPADLLERVDGCAEADSEIRERRVTRAEVIRDLIELGLIERRA